MQNFIFHNKMGFQVKKETKDRNYFFNWKFEFKFISQASLNTFMQNFRTNVQENIILWVPTRMFK